MVSKVVEGDVEPSLKSQITEATELNVPVKCTDKGIQPDVGV
jgi:hypothetical protein